MRAILLSLLLLAAALPDWILVRQQNGHPGLLQLLQLFYVAGAADLETGVLILVDRSAFLR